MNVVYHNRTDTGRIAEIDGKFYPYRWSLERAQVTWVGWFAGHSERGVKFVSSPCDTLEQAKRKLWR